MDTRHSQDAVHYRYDDFTEEHYAHLLELAKRQYAFESYGTANPAPHVLWRHDVDFSPHRALRLAQIEAARGVRSTYFFLLHCEFYNLLENSVRDVVLEIVGLGHDLGLHFDLAFYGLACSRDECERALTFERDVLQRVFSAPVPAFSFHNPDTGNALSFADNVLGGMVNTYGRSLREGYRYVSDSNGYWRFARLHDVLGESATMPLHVLTHPGWWTPAAMSPRDRISRCIDGRARRTHLFYDDLLNRYGRLNVR